jgi:signal transduction histidine kinase
LTKSSQIARLTHIADQVSIGGRYLPGTLVLGPNENPPRHVPLVVRDVIGQVRNRRELCRAVPGAGQPFRVSAGVIAETGGVWASWEEASAEVHDVALRERVGRREVLRELALTLSHELGNALVSLTTFRQSSPERPLPPPLVETIKADVAQLEALHANIALMQCLHEQEPHAVDVRDLAQHVGHSLGLRVEVGPDPVEIKASRKLLDFALRALIRTVGENRPDKGLREISLKVRSTGTGADLTALLSLKGKCLELEGILPEPVEGSVPNQGRLGVFLAKEILRLHHGEIHAGPGLEGTEILFSIRKW